MKLHSFFIALFISLFLKGEKPIAQTQYLPGNSIKYSLLDMMTFTGSSFLLSYEQPFGNRISMQMEGGYALGPNFGFFENSNIDGFKVRAELRYYLRDKSKSFHFIGLQAMYHSLSGTAVDDFCRDGCNYFQKIEYEKDFSNRGLQFIYGVSNYVSNNIILEAGGILGVRIRKQYNRNLPNDAELVGNDSGGLFEEGEFILPAVGFHVRLGFGW